MSHSLFNHSRKDFWAAIEANYSGADFKEQIKFLENALDNKESILEEFVFRTSLMNCWASLKNLESANKEAKVAREIFEKNTDSWNSTIDFIEYPAESLFISGLHWVAIYPDSIRPDMDEKSRKNAALDMMTGYYEVFVTFRILRILMFAHYLAIGDRSRAILELTNGVKEFNADTHLCSPIFHTLLGQLLKEDGEFVQSHNHLKNALTQYPRAHELLSLFDDKDKVFMGKIKDALGFWEGKAKSTIEEIEDKLPKKKCFIATAVYGSPYNENVIMLKYFRDYHLTRMKSGMQFINFYYYVSPLISKIIEKNRFLKTPIKLILLNPIIRLLRAIIN
jgi:hypothetical protein